MPIIAFLIALLISCVSAKSSKGQDTIRKAWFGAQLAPAENGAQGLSILQVSGGTAKALKILHGDILLEIDGAKMATTDDLRRHLSNKWQGNRVEILIKRKGKQIRLRGNYVGRPFETAKVGEIVYDFIPFAGGKLRCIVNKPAGNGPFPALLFIPGYTCSSIDNLSDNHPYKRIVDLFAAAGYVVLRVEKSGLGDSRNTPPCESLDLLDEIANFKAGLEYLTNLPYVHKGKILLFGHSMGGIIAPALAHEFALAGVAVYGTTAKSWFEYQIEMYRVQGGLANPDPIELEQYVRNQYAVNYRFFIQKEPLSEIAKDTALLAILRSEWQFDGKNQIYSRNADYWRQIQELPLLEYWKNHRGKTLVMFGEADFQAFSLADHKQIVDAVNYYHPGAATLAVIPGTDHYFAQTGSIEQSFQMFSEGKIQALFEAYNPKVSTTLLEWSAKVLGNLAY